jgi:hypothetical protein
MENLYKLVQWPESQLIMEHPDFKACHLIIDPEWMDVGSSAYFVPIDIYNQYFGEEVYTKGQVIDILLDIKSVVNEKAEQLGLLEDLRDATLDEWL